MGRAPLGGEMVMLQSQLFVASLHGVDTFMVIRSLFQAFQISLFEAEIAADVELRIFFIFLSLDTVKSA